MYPNYHHHYLSNNIDLSNVWSASPLCSALVPCNLSSDFGDATTLLCRASGITFDLTSCVGRFEMFSN